LSSSTAIFTSGGGEYSHPFRGKKRQTLRRGHTVGLWLEPPVYDLNRFTCIVFRIGIFKPLSENDWNLRSNGEKVNGDVGSRSKKSFRVQVRSFPGCLNVDTTWPVDYGFSSCTPYQGAGVNPRETIHPDRG